MQGVQGFGGAGGGRFAGPGDMMGAGGNAQGEPLRVTIANPNAMKQNVRAKPFLLLVSTYSCEEYFLFIAGCEPSQACCIHSPQS